MAFKIATYLDRIGLDQVPTTVDGLLALQQAQMRAIPYENIEVLLGDIPDLTENSIWAKLIDARRGGYCFELNKLFGLALEALDFTVRPILCRVRMGAREGGPRTHHALIVTIEGCDWLADAGFSGPAPIAPLRIDTKEQQIVGHDVYRLRTDPASGSSCLNARTKMNGSLFSVSTEPSPCHQISRAPTSSAHAGTVCPFHPSS